MQPLYRVYQSAILDSPVIFGGKIEGATKPAPRSMNLSYRPEPVRADQNAGSPSATRGKLWGFNTRETAVSH
jgi:hypothetical protein